MPFRKGESFELVIAITSEGYQVIVNGRQFYLFRHRIPVERVRVLEIGGGVSIQTVNIIRMNTPYVRPISSGLRPGMSVYLRGTIPHAIKSFNVNLQCGEKKDIALHFKPQFTPSEVVVFNTLRNDSWENEERVNVMPFHKGGSFELVFIVTPEGYQVNVDGCHFYLYKHRIPVEQVTAVQIYNDVSIQDMDIIEGEPGGIQICPGGLEDMSTPYVRPISCGLRTGMSLLFQGTILNTCDRFSINLKCGEKKDIALHFNPRFENLVVVFNTFRNSSWEQEETVNKMPFQKGKSFELFIVIKSHGYQVIANGRKFYLFKHRIPVEQVSALEINGDVSMQNFEIIQGVPGDIAICPGMPEEPDVQAMVVGNIPYVRPISGGLKMGMSVYFQGTIPHKVNRFHINFKCGDVKGCDKAMHLIARFRPCVMVGFNTFQNGCWKKEKRVHDMPFSKGESFEMVIVVATEGYQVNVNGQLFYVFKHHIPVEQVSALEIAGDVSVQTLNITEGEQDIMELPSEEEAVICTIPHVRTIHGGLRMGMSLCVKGIVPHEITSFGINLQCGEKIGCDKAFHFNPRFNTSKVVFNSFRNGSWENEERVDEMPFRKGEKFVLVIVITSEGYQVIVNNCQFYLFKHRIPLDQVSALEMDEDFSMSIIEGEQEGIQEQPDEEEIVTPQYVQTIDSVKTGMSVYFQGSIPDDIKGFSINLLCGEKDGCDNAFHFNPRFESANLVVFNTFRNGSWEEEERVNEMPFSKGEDFEMVIVITAEGYQVNVNGSPFHFFKHRFPVDQVSAIQIKEDVSMQTIEIFEGEQGGVDEDPHEDELAVSVPQYVQPISGGLKKGMSVYFQGTIPDETKQFSINLQCGEKDSDIALHFNPRLESSDVLFNTFQNGEWNEEEKVNEMPFHKGESFELVFIITSEGYQVIINDKKFYLFKHRVLVEHVGAMQINGDVFMQTITMLEGGEGDIQEQPGLDELVVTSPQYVQPIPGLKTGMSMYFQGSIPDEINKFSINLQCGETDGCDIALHFSPQFEPSQMVVFNSFKNGSWEQEEKVDEMPFSKGEKFELIFIITSEGYQVNVNSKPFHMFKLRMPVEQVSAVQIDGDICMETVTVIEVEEHPVGDSITLSPGETTVVEHSLQIASYVQPISGLRPGVTLYFQGSIPDEIDRFSIDLQCGETDGCDKVLHFNPQFEPLEGVVFNSFKDGSWEQEERVTEMPFSKGSDFELAFIITSEGYQVNVNSRPLHMFKHRLQVDQVCAVQITGNISMRTLNIVQDSMRGDMGEEYQTKELQVISGEPIYNPSIPYSDMIPGGMTPKKTIVISGNVPPGASSFACNFLVSSSGDTAFQINPRVSEGVVVRNSCKGGNWGAEERETDVNPFQEGKSFEMLVRSGNQKFTVYVNGNYMCDYVHHVQTTNQIDKLEIVGDVQLSYLLF
ncbi:hypothetical protein SKAU_G00087220 [Synaphobranchus kaupii]|uniref:Galectin domain-containing protein n=1 Tax=Synaphobranchus kaupii TaxID=118154 RepID=A0A9Q1FVN2_SYNKA|nr:hypothetical protein SKAU_G00087220 [Synaphobranchus kaupii]